MFSWLGSLFGSRRRSTPSSGGPSRLLPESKFVVELTEAEVIVHRPEGSQESVRFEDLRAVLIETNDSGPWGTDVWWILLGKDQTSGCVYPGGATGEGGALERLQRLPGFDDAAVIRAMGCCDNERFLCWKAPEPVVAENLG